MKLRKWTCQNIFCIQWFKWIIYFKSIVMKLVNRKTKNRLFVIKFLGVEECAQFICTACGRPVCVRIGLRGEIGVFGRDDCFGRKKRRPSCVCRELLSLDRCRRRPTMPACSSLPPRQLCHRINRSANRHSRRLLAWWLTWKLFHLGPTLFGHIRLDCLIGGYRNSRLPRTYLVVERQGYCVEVLG
jgi:hypothetical protein